MPNSPLPPLLIILSNEKCRRKNEREVGWGWERAELSGERAPPRPPPGLHRTLVWARPGPFLPAWSAALPESAPKPSDFSILLHPGCRVSAVEAPRVHGWERPGPWVLELGAKPHFFLLMLPRLPQAVTCVRSGKRRASAGARGLAGNRPPPARLFPMDSGRQGAPRNTSHELLVNKY